MIASPSRLLSYEEALERVLTNASHLSAETVGLDGLVGRVVVEPALSQTDLPAFDNSAVDGYGVHAADLARLALPGGAQLEVVREIAAGDDPGAFELSPGQAVRIFTGAFVPASVAAVAMQEDAERAGAIVGIRGTLEPGAHIRRRAEEIRQGTVILEAGRRADPGCVAAAAAAGIAEFRVSALPRVGVLATGSELVRPGEPVGPGKVFESNSFGLAAAVRSLGFGDARVARSGDDPRELQSALRDLLESSDVVLTTGGVSVGDHDLVRPALESLGVREVFWGVAVKPGKPLYFGLFERGESTVSVFGLPGNPLSTVASFQLFVLPHLIARMGGADPVPDKERAVLEERVTHKTGRLEFVPARTSIVEGRLVATRARALGSHMLGGLIGANAFVLVPADVAALEAGAEIETIPIRWEAHRA